MPPFTSKKISERASTADSEQDDDTCIICKREDPPKLSMRGKVAPVDWGQCDICDGWVHLGTCTHIVKLQEKDKFVCPNCVGVEE